MVLLPDAAAAPSGQEAKEAGDCMRAGADSKPDCGKPMPPCPLRTKVAGPPGPLVMLPNGVCGMLLDDEPKEN